MKIAIDITPLEKERVLWHRVRGTGFYIENLKKALECYFTENQYNFFTRGEKLPKDLDLVHYPYFEPFFLTLPIRKPAKAVITIHDLIPLVFREHFPVGIKGRLKWEIQRFSLKSVDAIITDSESSKKDIIRLTGVKNTKIHVVFLAPASEFRQINDTLLLRSIREKYNLPDKFALYVGDVTWNKNLPRLIEAIKSVDIPLVMVGKALISEDFDKSNPWNSDLVKVQEIVKDSSQIIRLGFIPTGDLVAIYNLATVFVMPSLYEGFGLPVLEAMACGVPIVVAKTSSLPEIAGQAALWVDPYNTESITDGIKEVLKNKAIRDELIKKGFSQVKKFSWQKTMEKTVMVYENVFPGSRSHSDPGSVK